MDDNRRILTVTQLNEYIKMLIDSNPQLSDIYIRGEISNFTNHYKTGHFYFTLKDSSSLLKTVMFRSSAERLKFMPEAGMRVVVHGRISAFVRDGQYQLYADSIEPDGVGSLYIAYGQLKARLEEEGLFSAARKRPLPKIPLKIGIITSPTGAAVRDIINILGRRFPLAGVILWGATVQGDSAPAQLIAGLEYFNSRSDIDVIIIGRGGGSIEDLWVFNDERLARAVVASRIPVISAVGHETDFTICDFAADTRAPTPSAAAELAVPETGELKRKIGNIVAHTELLIENRITAERNRVKTLSASRVLTAPENMLDDRRMAVLSLTARIESAAKLSENRFRAMLASNAAKLDALNPLSIIARGYSAVYTDDGLLVKSTEQLKVGDEVSFRLSDGGAKGKITELNKNKRGF